jgi:hypothetical protein
MGSKLSRLIFSTESNKNNDGFLLLSLEAFLHFLVLAIHWIFFLPKQLSLLDVFIRFQAFSYQSAA